MTAFLSALAGGFLLSLTFPPVGFNFLAWVAFIPLFWSLSMTGHPGRSFLCGFLFGFGFFLADLSWIYNTLITHGHFSPVAGVAVFLGMIGFLSLYPGVFGFVMGFFSGKGISSVQAAPFIWIAQEYMRSELFTGFPWDLVGYSQAGRLIVVQAADLTGVYGISFLVLLVNAALWELLRPKIEEDRISWKLIAAAGLAVVLVLSYGNARLKQFSSTHAGLDNFTTGVLQGNIPQEVKWEDASRQQTFAVYEKLGREAVEQGAELLIWPETSVPVVFGGRDQDWMLPGLISERLGVPMLVGAPSKRKVNNEISYYNSAFLIDSRMLRFRYDKMHLVPFGEYMPWSWILPLGPGLAAREADYSAGKTMTVMHWKDCPPFSVLICYEAIFPELARLGIQDGAKWLVNITNDGWFGDTAAPYQHMAMAGLRSVENRVWLLRAANTGISAAFDPSGRSLRSIPLQQEGFFTVKVGETAAQKSFYSRFGDVFAWGCVGITLFLGFSTMGFRRRGRLWKRN
ncbi:MAG TPA: apolipoprotein N-acyltransferase [Desulfomonilaceae bacterium]|nr:apolipoprotein N-acyltransferase [Desulfomonilaceae bacterium]